MYLYYIFPKLHQFIYTQYSIQYGFLLATIVCGDEEVMISTNFNWTPQIDYLFEEKYNCPRELSNTHKNKLFLIFFFE